MVLHWIAPRPLEPLYPSLPTDGDSSVVLDLFALPLGRIAPSTMGCMAPTRCSFRVPPGTTFQDGSAVTPTLTANAIRSAWKGWKQCASCRVAVEGDRVVVTADRPGIALLPFAPIEKPGPEGRWVGTGPYRVVVQTPSHVTLAAIREGRQPARIDVTSAHGTRGVLARLLSGADDLATNVPADHLRLLKAASRVGSIFPLKNALTVLVFNERDPRLASAAVRRCIAAGLARGFRRLRQSTHLDEIPVAFRSQTAEEGCLAGADSLPRGPLTMEVIPVGYLRRPAEGVIATLGDLGIDVDPLQIPSRAAMEPLQSSLRLTVLNINYPTGPIPYVRTGGPLNTGHHSDPKLDVLLDAGAGWASIQAELGRSPAFVPLGIVPRYVVTSPRFRILPADEMGPGPFSLGLAIRPANESP